ncbi:unnamed protein product [Boreogadus saida]
MPELAKKKTFFKSDHQAVLRRRQASLPPQPEEAPTIKLSPIKEASLEAHTMPSTVGGASALGVSSTNDPLTPQTGEGPGTPAAGRRGGVSWTRRRLYPSAVPIPTGITATCRRPIKGPAGRPVLHQYPDAPPTSPTTLECREVDARLVPLYAQ